MTWLAGAVFIFGVGFGAMMTAWWLTGRPDREAARVPLVRMADPRPLPSEYKVHMYQRADGSLTPAYGDFPVDTGPLLLVSEAMAAAQSITREVEEMTRAAERKARPWR